MVWWQWVVLALAILAWFVGLLWFEHWLNRKTKESNSRAEWETEQREARWEQRHTD